MKGTWKVLGMAALLSLSLAWAQSLAKLAPPGSILTLSYHRQALPGDTLERDLAKLDWAKAGHTLDQLQKLLGNTADSSSLSGELEGRSSFLSQLQDCPRLNQTLKHDPLSLFSDALLSVSTSSYAPLPAVTLIARAAAGQTQSADALQQAVLNCAKGGQTTLEQGGVTLYVLGNGGNFPVIIGHMKDVYFASSSPEAARGVVRRAQGSSEPSFADSDIYQRSQTLSKQGLGFTLDLSALADLAERALIALASDPESQYSAHRASAALRTLGGVAGSVSVSPDGLLLESLTAVNPKGGDPKLADLLLCRTCSLITPPLIPSGSVSVQTRYFSLRDLFSYVQDWLTDAPQPTDLTEAIQQSLGLDVDKGLLGWLGSSFTLVTLKPIGTDLKGLFYGPSRALIVPVTSQAEARAGMQELGRALVPLFDGLLEQLSESDNGDSLGALLQGASDSFTYRGVTVQRYRSGVNTDEGLAYLGSYLVVASPSAALKPIIDTFKGVRPNILQDSGYRAALTASPDRVVSLGYADVQAQAGGLADLLRFFSQPVAFGLTVALADQSSRQAKPGYADLLQLTDILPDALEIIGQHLGSGESYSEVKGDDIYRRTLVHVSW